jgi:hypothetical protein
MNDLKNGQIDGGTAAPHWLFRTNNQGHMMNFIFSGCQPQTRNSTRSGLLLPDAEGEGKAVRIDRKDLRSYCLTAQLNGNRLKPACIGRSERTQGKKKRKSQKEKEKEKIQKLEC